MKFGWFKAGLLALMVSPGYGQIYRATSVEAIDGQVRCVWVRDRLITVISGPCDDFIPPRQIRVGDTFKANGRTKTINIIVAMQTEKGLSSYPASVRDWTCTAAESASDIPDTSERGPHIGTWLYIPKCKPVE
jgi:hypothetical protein